MVLVGCLLVAGAAGTIRYHGQAAILGGYHRNVVAAQLVESDLIELVLNTHVDPDQFPRLQAAVEADRLQTVRQTVAARIDSYQAALASVDSRAARPHPDREEIIAQTRENTHTLYLLDRATGAAEQFLIITIGDGSIVQLGLLWVGGRCHEIKTSAYH